MWTLRVHPTGAPVITHGEYDRSLGHLLETAQIFVDTGKLPVHDYLVVDSLLWLALAGFSDNEFLNELRIAYRYAAELFLGLPDNKVVAS